MNNGFSIYEQVNPINQDINIVYSPITPVLKYDYYIIKDGVKSGAINISGNTPSNILLTETGNYEIEVNTYDYYNNVTVIKSGIYNIDKEAPVINIKDNNIELELNSAYNFLNSVEVTDNQDSDVSSNILISKDDDFFTTSGIKKVTYTVSDNAGNTTTETLNVNVVDNRISDIAYLFVGMLCIISFVLIAIYYRMTTLVKRVGKYGLEPLDDNTPSLFDQVVKKYTEILAELNKYLEKSVFITKYSKRYNKYLNIVNHNYLNGMYYVSNKVIISIAFLLVALVSEAIRVSTVGFEVVVLSLLVDNTSGVLSRVSGMFSRRGYNIDSLTVGVTENPQYSRMTVAVSGDDRILSQIKKQLLKLEDVISITELKDGESVCRELVLVKIKASTEERQQIISLADVFRAKVVDVSKDSVMCEITGNVSKIEAFISLLDGFTIEEMVRTGLTGLTRGHIKSED